MPSMADGLGTTWPVFIGFTLVVMGFVAYMTGQAVAQTWRPLWQVVPYGLLLGAADRFLVFSLFHGPLLSIAGYGIDAAALTAIATIAHRLTQARKMTMQYPWLYERIGLFGWRKRS